MTAIHSSLQDARKKSRVSATRDFEIAPSAPRPGAHWTIAQLFPTAATRAPLIGDWPPEPGASTTTGVPTFARV